MCVCGRCSAAVVFGGIKNSEISGNKVHFSALCRCVCVDCQTAYFWVYHAVFGLDCWKHVVFCCFWVVSCFLQFFGFIMLFMFICGGGAVCVWDEQVWDVQLSNCRLM